MDDVPDRVEHTVLGPRTGWPDVVACLDAADELGMRCCVPPGYVAGAADYADVALTTVVDFPHGQGATDPVAEAARSAVAHGADEVDVVAPVGRFLAGDSEGVFDHLTRVTGDVDVPVKVILETPLLADSERDALAALAADAGAAYLKTATGFADGGATVEDVAAVAEYAPVKASGGIDSWGDASAMLDAGADRIGASSGAAIVHEWREAR